MDLNIIFDYVFEDKKLEAASVSKVLKEFFSIYNYKNKKVNKSYENGYEIHKKLGYDNDIIFSKYYYLKDLYSLNNDYYFKLSGCPDKISLINNDIYIDELKTIPSYKSLDNEFSKYLLKYAEIQLQLYMDLTNVKKGRLFLYFKDSKKCELYKTYSYNKKYVKTIILDYFKILYYKQRLREEYENLLIYI